LDGFARFRRDASTGGNGNLRGPGHRRRAAPRVPGESIGISGTSAHLFFNEHSVPDIATERTSAFVITGTVDGRRCCCSRPYHDQFVLEEGAWKFRRREVRSTIPAPGAPAPRESPRN
jgi:hypothetical protein